MVNEQEKYIEFLNFAKSSIETTAASVSPLLDLISRNFSETLSDCEKNVEGAQLLVPITGMFSAGKSSLLNAFLGGCLLPVGISPETALATELHFDTHQRIEAINHTGAIEHFDFSSFGEISRRADEFEYLRVFVSSPALKNIQPLILVDMPGFDSPLDTHNKAILNFIDRGAHYVVLVSVEEGGLTRPVINRLQGILDNGRLFSLCLSKVDLRPPLQRAEVLQHIAEQLSANFGVTQEVVVFDQTSAGERLRTLIDDIDPNRLVRSLFSNTIKDIFLRLDADTNIVLTTLGKNAEEISRNLDELRAALAQLESEKVHQLEKLRERNEGSRQVQSVLNSVKQRLTECTEQLVQSAMSSQELLSQQVNEIVQGVLVGALRKAHGEVSSEAVMNFSRAMEGNIRTGFVLPPDMVTTLVEHIKEPLTAAIFSKIGNASGNKSGKGGMASAGATAGLIAYAAGLGPLGVALSAILPGIMEWLAGSVKENRQREQITQALRNQVFPDIIRQLRPQVETFLQDAIESAVNSLAGKYEEHLTRQREILAEAEKSPDLMQIEEQRSVIQEMQSLLRKKAEALIFSV